MTERQKNELRKIVDESLARVNPYDMIESTVTLEGSTLNIDTDAVHDTVDLDLFDRILVMGAGKASAPMARAIEDILGDRVTDGFVSVKDGHLDTLSRIRIHEAGHPIPDDRSVEAGTEMLELARAADRRTLCIVLISGGGSALVEAPLSADVGRQRIELSLRELQRTTEALLECGATIHEINTVRKHLSAVKGGRLADALAPAHSVSLILSDVVGDDFGSIASGPTVGDTSTYADAIALIERYRIADRIPAKVTELLRAGAAGRVPESVKPGGDALRLVLNVLVGTNHQALLAASAAASTLGYETMLLTSRLTGEARETAGFLESVIGEIRSHGQPVGPPACLLSGGETTVTIHGKGRGGRNQELALAMIGQMVQNPELYRDIAFVSAATDGTDGPTDAAGAFASTGIADKASASGLNWSECLANNDSYHFFDSINELLRTGPTNTNVCDIQVALIPD